MQNPAPPQHLHHGSPGPWQCPPDWLPCPAARGILRRVPTSPHWLPLPGPSHPLFSKPPHPFYAVPFLSPCSRSSVLHRAARGILLNNESQSLLKAPEDLMSPYQSPSPLPHTSSPTYVYPRHTLHWHLCIYLLFHLLLPLLLYVSSFKNLDTNVSEPSGSLLSNMAIQLTTLLSLIFPHNIAH